MGLLTSGYSTKRDGPTGRARGTSHVFMGWHHIWKAAALWWVSTQKAIIRVWLSNRLDGGRSAVSASILLIIKPLPFSGKSENTARSPSISLHLFSFTVTSFAICRFSKLCRCVLPNEPIPAVLLMHWGRNVFFWLLTLHVLVHTWSTGAPLQYKAWWWEQYSWHAPLLVSLDIVLNSFAGRKTQKFRERIKSNFFFNLLCGLKSRMISCFSFTAGWHSSWDSNQDLFFEGMISYSL